LYLEDLKLLGITNEVTYARHLEEVFGFEFGDAFNMAMDFSEKYDDFYKEFKLDDLFPTDKWMERQERISKNSKQLDWILSRADSVKITQVMKEFKVSREQAIELMKDAVLGYGVVVSRMMLDLRDIPNNKSDFPIVWE
jgi:hypothetical protein